MLFCFICYKKINYLKKIHIRQEIFPFVNFYFMNSFVRFGLSNEEILLNFDNQLISNFFEIYRSLLVELCLNIYQIKKQNKTIKTFNKQKIVISLLTIDKAMSRVSIYIITFFTYASIHMMRTTYSFNKPEFQTVFGLSNLFLGFLDALIYITLAIGTFARYSIINSLHPVDGCLYTAFPTAIGFILIPLMAFFYDHSQSSAHGSPLTYVIFTIAALTFGFFQLNFFPAMLTIFGHSFNIKNDGRIVGIWSSKSNAGNILGFLMANLLVYQFNIKWQFTMIICSCLLIIMSILLKVFIQDPDFKQQPRITSKQFFSYFRRTWKHNQFKFYILSFSFFKAVIYSYELWTPKFLVEVGFKKYSGYVPMIFDASTLFGSYIMGHIYKAQSNADTTKQDSVSRAIYFLNKYKFFVPGIIVVIVSFCYMLAPSSLAVYFVFGALMGMFLGAVYNSLQNSQVLNYTNNQSTKTDMFSTINIGIGSSMVGITQFIIGLSLHLGSDDQDQSKLIKKGLIYIVIGCIAIIATVITFIRTCYEKATPEMTFSQKTQKYDMRDQMMDRSSPKQQEDINNSIDGKSQLNEPELKF